ncbi:hypothetical protein L1987_00838 [Smallanthus sonchifolius]|uniref:Uncharacterized protein n=1 Tax=Smallanthus sonchifolius TaxID=185202 RepID=A0ACB9K3E9_9ASTR|nr:hypothetical protein L1987_00838 [Smallanthus sonchifolius]
MELTSSVSPSKTPSPPPSNQLRFRSITKTGFIYSQLRSASKLNFVNSDLQPRSPPLPESTEFCELITTKHHLKSTVGLGFERGQTNCRARTEAHHKRIVEDEVLREVTNGDDVQ